jgi:hypothetical protein
MKLKNLLTNALVIVASCAVAVLMCEVAARFVTNSGDYVSVSTMSDDVLGITIKPKSPGFDEWGFRNPSVPKSVDVVAVGDSHTFGNTAREEDAWPSVVRRGTGLSVYNLGLGGYGPNQYYRLLTTRGLALHPTWVFCGLYMGDDFENAFSITYGLDYWKPLRAGAWSRVNADIWDQAAARPWHKDVRAWLSRNSIMYQLLVHGPLLAKFKEDVEFKRALAGTDPLVTALVDENRNIREAFRPASMASRLDQGRPEVREGMRLTFRLLQDMQSACVQSGCRFTVVIIPTKESVFAEYFDARPQIHLHDAVQKTITNERIARGALEQFLTTAGIPYVDTLPALRSNVSKQLYARTTNDMHPGPNGYRMIGDEVTAYINRGRVHP